jgi:hypothetical protein
VGSLNDSDSTITTFTPANPAGSRVALIRRAAATYRCVIWRIPAAE